MDNPARITIPAKPVGSITCISNSPNYQRITINLMEGAIIFEGSGNQPMKLSDGSTVHYPQDFISAYMTNVEFEYSVNGPNGPFILSTVGNSETVCKEFLSVTEIVSKDSSKDSASYLCLILANAVSENQELTKNIDGTVFKGILNLQAKTHYDNPLIPGSDQHKATVDLENKIMDYLSPNWTAHDSELYIVQTSFGGYLHVVLRATNCTLQDMENAILLLFTTICYLQNLPTGACATNWRAELFESQWTVTKVTN